MTIVIALTMVVMSRNFKDRTRTQTSKDDKKKSKLRTEIDDHANRTTALGLTVYDCCILGCMLLNISTKGSISSFETLGISIAMSHFDMFASRAGTIVACCGTIGVVALLCMGHLTKHFTDIQLICGGMGFMAVGIFSLSFAKEIEVNPSWRFTTAIFMIYSIGYPIGHTAVIGMFSKSKWKNETS
jgi:ceroid-lipofuscinosis MFS transporter 7